ALIDRARLRFAGRQDGESGMSAAAHTRPRPPRVAHENLPERFCDRSRFRQSFSRVSGGDMSGGSRLAACVGSLVLGAFTHACSSSQSKAARPPATELWGDMKAVVSVRKRTKTGNESGLERSRLRKARTCSKFLGRSLLPAI